MSERRTQTASANRPAIRPAVVLSTTVLHLAVSVAALAVLCPFLWMFCASFKTHDDVRDFAFLPWNHLQSLTLDNFRTLFHAVPFGRWLVNSVLVSSTSTLLVVTFSSLGGFALAKYRFAGKRILMGLMLSTMLMPSIVLLPSSYELMYRFGCLDSYAALIIPGTVSAFGMFLFRQAMLAIPDDLLHAARVDGCSELRLWWEIALPAVRPMIGAFTLLSFLGSWNSYLWPQVVLQDPAKYTVPIGLAGMLGLPGFQAQYGVLMAGAMLAVIPVLVLFFVLQKDFIAGLISGAVKG